MEGQVTIRKIEEHFRKKVQKDPTIHNAYLLVESEKNDLHVNMAEGTTGNTPVHAQQPYYIASVSKLFTSVLFAILVEKGMCSFDEYMTKYLEPNVYHNLHVYQGKDYTNGIQLKHLLNHTSGLQDFLEDKPTRGKSMVELVLNDPAHQWTPREVITWAKENMRPFFPPGQGFHYSDTGYHLLGLIIENITNQPLHEAYHQYIFQPLQMTNSYLHGSTPIEKSKYPVADLYIQNVNIVNHQSLSIVYAGGGIVSTNKDLLTFMKALVEEKIIGKNMIQKMKADCGKFFLGIDYGYGIMNIKTVPILMPAKYNAWGNAGSTGSFMFYHPGKEAYVIGSFNHFGYGQKGIRFLLQVVNKLS
ncbi:serine hydrolase domain-containing protein [Salinibacillus xinjiangensis]|uniref:Serine hydrolase n=1 Tax=Salinibacillus xinjiangensis TaxID=1229268 RepID=A0A6G1XAU3_9BACI|nr:serine hydrolase domain-containing protein [Salinibacillus xinjiangensis]MRG88131.1 serine hydrolase [Salinibacillus xinjiangensis]